MNNAGFTFDKMLHTCPDDTFDIIMKIHVRAPFRLIRQAAPYFRLKVCSFHSFRWMNDTTDSSDSIQPEQRENRSIINISSVSGLHGGVGQINYSSAKAAVLGMTKTIAKEWGPFGVRANAVAFGMIHTRYDFTVCFLHASFHIAQLSFTVNRLTAAKEAGATIEIAGKKVALGIPGAAKSPETTAPESLTHIPLRRGGTPEDAAGSVLL